MCRRQVATRIGVSCIGSHILTHNYVFDILNAIDYLWLVNSNKSNVSLKMKRRIVLANRLPQ